MRVGDSTALYNKWGQGGIIVESGANRELSALGGSICFGCEARLFLVN